MTEQAANNRNVDDAELAKFAGLAHKWWDKESEFRPLHEINPLRLGFIDNHANLAGKRVLDVGCGGGILSEAMVQAGASVTGLDLAEKSLKIAKLHGLESGVTVDYRCLAVEELAAAEPASFDAVTCMEMLEHVPEPASVVAAVAQLVKPGGWVFFSTINRNPKAYLHAVVGAEYILGLLARGTHEYAKFIKPSELARMARNNGLEMVELKGMGYDLIAKSYHLNDDATVNYLLACRKSAA
ncbi:bifunctional 2-polyprenyl-6-hydroxyphenol methylase/3-demethylubiquinol 3-O-methyltransferase UbiG [Chitinimonas sp. BJB300]|uniref:bifunctional 2-polyprenyl-6-hydroxyphenol methylase/3-demethylubiquinol 3-O-methyltransferase UbiG n=1 Tax=Chitinimonas sp. BJB300 TaxID=1559339 RepID=UPI000C11DC4F|nr:bifunctional 2-polyprenyl-6-hydroxyphenol methylase/3-demethylubiquinol 3-O-methyltransferase UbiG [Chitinimonas sp. BJB300]PHV11767.1 bifunctional 3-demethylubiquinol 3-O-methyltransferase/2-polyprenyl-6-hydroxyphenol methylase [Chitinimonas sp. BJB300]TSJ87093.1 bifunctional 2-polyprenyl-6-hydroxyphenol methylase/3-demethylubiquinol 3-O-methyltransferase UbiG [Chitinimonas sp. BJB300]